MRALGPISRLWHRVPEDIFDRLGVLLNGRQATVFVRADDIGIPSASQNRLLELFIRQRTPLCAAVVPTWMTPARWRETRALVGHHDHLFAWHQHGWNHRNHQLLGKKQEFGSEVAAAEKERMIVAGRRRLEAILGGHFLPVFTPPWNRVDLETLETLQDRGFLAISRYRDDKLASLPGLPDFPANVDLHTRKEATAELAWQGLMSELSQALEGGMVGLMLHHQRMNETAFVFLQGLLTLLQSEPRLHLCHFGDMLDLRSARRERVPDPCHR